MDTASDARWETVANQLLEAFGHLDRDEALQLFVSALVRHPLTRELAITNPKTHELVCFLTPVGNRLARLAAEDREAKQGEAYEQAYSVARRTADAP